ncbi:MAG: O-antigen ligase family protein [Flaviaesturariibacter sp.]|nr:O-antigen ligase family protein [Flaviaesturariibacter sp.]
MNEHRTTPETLRSRITYLLLLFFVMSLPFDRFYSQVLLICLVIHTMIHLRTERLRACLQPRVLVLQAVYFSTMLATLYTAHRTVAFGFWEKQVAIFLFPLILALNPVDRPGFSKPLLRAFAVMITALILYLYADAVQIIRFYRMPASTVLSGLFLSHQFSAPLALHATYLSLFCALSILVLIDLLHERQRNVIVVLALAGIAILAMGLLQLASKAVLIGLFLVLVFLVPHSFRDRGKRLAFVCLSILAFAGFALLVEKAGGLQDRIVSGLRTDLGNERPRYSIADPRAARWRIAWQQVQKAPVFGHGAGEELILLRDGYFRKGLYDSYLNKLNAHNQYMSLLLKGGIPALAAFLLTITYAFRHAWRQRSRWGAGLVVLLAVVSVSENILDVNKGIFFFSFFLSLLVLGEQPAPGGVKGIKKPRSNHQKPGVVLTTSDLLP